MPLISIHSEDIKELKHRKAGPKQQMLVTEIDTVTSILIIWKLKHVSSNQRNLFYFCIGPVKALEKYYSKSSRAAYRYMSSVNHEHPAE